MNVRAYYNEIDGYTAQWLRNLIAAGLIAPGDVDTRSIVDVRPDDLAGYTQCHFFAGLGGWSGALRLAGVADNEPIWTGSCPCQPFSLAGKQKGFADERHLWPIWRELIRECNPAKVFGEQVASSSAWLGLVRGDLEAMGYAVGTIPIEAASAGADHLRDRIWFVGHADDQGRLQQEGLEPAKRRRAGHTSGVGLADTHDAGSQGRRLLPECAGERVAGPDGLADADQLGAREEWQQRSGQQCGAGCDQETCNGSDVADACRGRAGYGSERGPGAQGEIERQHGGTSRASFAPRVDGDYEWVIGADGKARRVKPGVRLLAHGIPARVAKLRALGNAIDLRPAAAFIQAANEAIMIARSA